VTNGGAVGPAEIDLPEAPRRLLRRGATGERLELARTRLCVGWLPLVRRLDGRPCLRVAAAGAGSFDLQLRCGETVVDSATLEAEGSVRLFAPADEGVVLDIRSADGTAMQHAIAPTSQRRWTVHLVHHSHLDLGYTDLQPTVLRHHLAYLDSVLDLARQTDGWPDDARFRWNVEANLPLRHWLRQRPAAAVEELLDRVREGRIEVCALPFTSNLEVCSIDELASQLDWASEFSRAHRVPVVTAMQTDVPGQGYGLPALLADAGVRYLDVAHNFAARAAVHLTGGFELPRLFHWEHAGKRVLVWHTDSPRGVAYLEGNLLHLADSAEAASWLLPEYLAALAEHGYPYGNEIEALGIPADVEIPARPYPLDVLHMRVQGVIADNAAPSAGPAEVVRAWNDEWASPRLRLSTNRDFFEETEQRVDDVPVFTGDWANWWADGVGSSARMLGANRRAQAKLRTAQTLQVVADLSGEAAAWSADDAYERLGLFDEHTWGAAFPEGDGAAGRSAGALQWQLKSSYALEAKGAADALLDSALARLRHQHSLSVAVLNVCGFARSDVVRIFVPTSVAPPGVDLVVRERDGGEIPSTTVHVGGTTERNRPQGRTISFFARDVPPVGYRTYELARGTLTPSEQCDGSALESDAYQVEVDIARACARSVFDKALGRELVDTSSAFGFGQYVHDRYVDDQRATRRADATSATLPRPRATPPDRVLARRTALEGGELVSHTSSPVEEMLTVCDGNLETTFRLPHGTARLELRQRLAKEGTLEKESVYFVFPFAVERPEITYELTGGAVAREASYVPGSARHMNAIRNWVALQEAEASLAWCSLEAPLIELGDIYAPFPPYPPTVGGSNPGLVVSWAMNNVWDTNFPIMQSGEAMFSYAVASGDGDARVLAMRTAASLTQPLVGILADVGTAGCLCRLDRDDVELVGLAAAPGHAFAVRLLSNARERACVCIEFPDLNVEPRTLELEPGEYVQVPVDL
jgi:hypothetical protein